MPVLRFRRNRGPVIPEGTTHVIDHFTPSPDMTGGIGAWELWTLAGYLAGTPGADATCFDAAADTGEADLAAHTGELLGYPVTLTRFETEIDEGNGWTAEPAFYVTPAR
jgi:hypothetical protein